MAYCTPDLLLSQEWRALGADEKAAWAIPAGDHGAEADAAVTR